MLRRLGIWIGGQSSTDAIRKMGKTGTVNFFATGSSETSSKGGGKA
jgi:hypothetical protein